MPEADEQHRLTQEEVHERIGVYARKANTANVRISETSSIAFLLGQQLLGEVMNRSGQIDSKGLAILGWSGAILVFLLLHVAKIYRSDSVGLKVLVAPAIVLAFISAFSGAWASHVRSFRGVSDETWFPDPINIMDAEHLQQHYIEELHESRTKWDIVCQRKAVWLTTGQNCLSASAYITLLTVVYALMLLLSGVGTSAFFDG
jgi:hypothetical protein